MRPGKDGSLATPRCSIFEINVCMDVWVVLGNKANLKHVIFRD